MIRKKQKITHNVSRYFLLFLITIFLVLSNITTVVNVQAADHKLETAHGTLTQYGSGVNVGIESLECDDNQMYIVCNVVNFEDYPLTVDKCIMDVTNTSGELIATQLFDNLNCHLNPGESKMITFVVTDNNFIPNANIDGYYWENNCYWTKDVE